MEEASALGDEISVMKKGEFVAFGDAVTLKKQYGCPYRINCNVQKEDLEKAKSLFKTHLKQYKVLDESAGSLVIEVDEISDDMLTILELLETSKELSYIQGFGVSQGTLEDVFIKLMRA